MALVSSDFLIIPTMSDFSSLEGIKGILMLLYGKYPSSAVRNYASKVLTFSRQINNFGLTLPSIFELALNNFTSNSGVASAFGSVNNEIVSFCWDQYQKDPSIFASTSSLIQNKHNFEKTFFSEVKDFHTAGRISATLGIPLYELTRKTSYYMPDMTHVVCPRDRYAESLQHLNAFVSKI